MSQGMLVPFRSQRGEGMDGFCLQPPEDRAPTQHLDCRPVKSCQMCGPRNCKVICFLDFPATLSNEDTVLHELVSEIP